MEIQWIEKAKQAASVEELLKLAKENNIELSGEQAKKYYDRLQTAAGELSDDELDAVAGGGCGSSPSAPKSITVSGRALDWRCPVCHNDCWDLVLFGTTVTQKLWYCCVCAETDGYSSAPRVNVPGQEWSFPVVHVTINKK